MNLEITGRLIEKYPTQQISDKFKKREFVLDITEEVNGNSYPNFAKLQAVQNRCEMLDNFNVGDTLKVNFNVRGNKWEKDGKINYITSLDAWRIESVNIGATTQQPYAQPNNQPQYQAPPSNSNFNNSNFNNNNTEVNDDLPF